MSTIENLPGLLRRLDIEPRGVVHVGAHLGEEVPIYQRIGFRHIILVEPNRELADQIDESQPAVQVIRAACGAYAGVALFHVTTNTKLSSLHRPLKREISREITVDVTRLADLQDGCNVAVVDAQGAELDVMAGANLDGLDLVVLEAREPGMYAGCPSVADVVAWMGRSGWTEVARWPHGLKRPAKLFDVVFTPAVPR